MYICSNTLHWFSWYPRHSADCLRHAFKLMYMTKRHWQSSSRVRILPCPCSSQMNCLFTCLQMGFLSDLVQWVRSYMAWATKVWIQSGPYGQFYYGRAFSVMVLGYETMLRKIHNCLTIYEENPLSCNEIFTG